MIKNQTVTFLTKQVTRFFLFKNKYPQKRELIASLVSSTIRRYPCHYTDQISNFVAEKIKNSLVQK